MAKTVKKTTKTAAKTKTTKAKSETLKSKGKAPAFKHTAIMGAIGKAYKDGRMMAFRDNPCEKTMNAMLTVAEKELRKLGGF